MAARQPGRIARKSVAHQADRRQFRWLGTFSACSASWWTAPGTEPASRTMRYPISPVWPRSLSACGTPGIYRQSPCTCTQIDEEDREAIAAVQLTRGSAGEVRTRNGRGRPCGDHEHAESPGAPGRENAWRRQTRIADTDGFSRPPRRKPARRQNCSEQNGAVATSVRDPAGDAEEDGSRHPADGRDAMGPMQPIDARTSDSITTGRATDDDDA
jgi:hypothetical protein